MLKKNYSLDKLKNGHQILGTWNIINSPLVVDVICSTGIDFLVIDSEHGAVSYETAQTLAMVCESHLVSPIFRVGGVIEDQILRALDIGMHGVQVPNIRSAEEMHRLVEFAKYPPIGRRGFSPYTRAGGFDKGNAKKLTHVGNSNTYLIVNVEDEYGLNNLKDIVAIEAVDVIFIGLFDLSKSLGVPGDVESPLVLEKLSDAIDVIHAAHKKVGSIAASLGMLNLLKDMKVDYLTYSVDSGILFDGYTQICNEWNKS